MGQQETMIGNASNERNGYLCWDGGKNAQVYDIFKIHGISLNKRARVNSINGYELVAYALHAPITYRLRVTSSAIRSHPTLQINPPPHPHLNILIILFTDPKCSLQARSIDTMRFMSINWNTYKLYKPTLALIAGVSGSASKESCYHLRFTYDIQKSMGHSWSRGRDNSQI